MTSGEEASVVDDEGVVELTRELVRARSVHDPARGAGEAAAAAVVAQQMRDWGWPVTVVEVAPGRPNVVAVVEGGGGPGPTLMFEGHTDVVTEGDLASWSVDPFGAELRDGRIWGRGSADMKSGVAAMLHAVRALQLTGPFPGRVVVAVLVDEEGLMLGAKHFAASWRSLVGGEIDGVIVCEPEGGEVCAVAKGAIRLRLELTGAMAHGAMPQHARNPITVAAEIVGALADVEAGLQSRYGTHEHLGPAYVTPTVLLAGDTDQINVIPARATLCLDVRTVPGVDHEALVREVGAAARGGRRAGWGRRRGRRRGRPAAGGHGAGPPGRGRGGRGARGGDGLATDVRRGAGRDGRHDPGPRRRTGDRRLRAGRQVDRAPGGRVRGGGRRAARDPGLRRGGSPVPERGRAVSDRRTGPTNSLVDVVGLRVGHAQRVGEGWLTGSTVVLTGAAGAVGGVDVRGGGPGTRETDLLDPRNNVQRVHAVLLTGGSAFGLAAADGVMARLAAAGVGYPVGPEPGQVVPIVPAAVVFDLGRGGDFTARPDASFGGLAYDEAAGPAWWCGGAGRLRRCGNRCGGGRPEGRGGVGQRGAAGRQHGRRAGGRERGRLDGRPRHRRAAGCAAPAARRGPGAAATVADDLAAALDAAASRPEPRPPLATTLVVLGTDLALSKAQCQKVAGLGHDGLARAINPVHTMFDGDTVFALATGVRGSAGSVGVSRPAGGRCRLRDPGRGARHARRDDRRDVGGCLAQLFGRVPLGRVLACGGCGPLR